MIFKYAYDSPIGQIEIAEENGKIIQISFGFSHICDTIKETESIRLAHTQLVEYFDGKRKEFTVPIKTNGTAFQQKVWTALMAVPYGETASYGEIAKAVGSPKAYRAVGGADHVNKIPIIIPCHRIIGSSGKPVGYAGGLEIKKFLLDLERKYK